MTTNEIARLMEELMGREGYPIDALTRDLMVKAFIEGSISGIQEARGML